MALFATFGIYVLAALAEIAGVLCGLDVGAQ
jgi:hypothetical protein